MKISFLFAWYDLWIGFFWDGKKGVLYIFPVPMFGVMLKFNNHKQQVKTVAQLRKDLQDAERALRATKL